MPRKPALDVAGLAALGAEKLARLILGEAERNAPFRKLANAALAGAKGPEAVARQVDRRLAALEKAGGFIDWQKERAFAADLAATLRVVTEELSAAPAIGVDCLLRFVATHGGVLGRVDDSAGRVQAVYEDAVDAFADLAAKLSEDERRRLPDRIQPMLEEDGFGYNAAAALAAIPLLPPDTLAGWDKRLAQAVTALGERVKAAESGRKPAGRSAPVAAAGFADMESLAALGQAHRFIELRQAIADARGDLDMLLVLEEAKPPRLRNNAAMAARLLEAGRPAEALDWIRRKAERPGIAYLDREGVADGSTIRRFGDRSRALMEAKILDALGRGTEAQALRWSLFEATLDAEALRAHVERLGDFEEFAVLDRAFAHVMKAKERYRALSFLLAWPRLDLAAGHVLAHAAQWDGGSHEVLGEAAEALEDAFPLAATVLYRALLGDILARSKSQAYGHGARHLAALDRLGGNLRNGELRGAGLTEHDAFRAELRRNHGRKAAFWSKVEEIRPK